MVDCSADGCGFEPNSEQNRRLKAVKGEEWALS